MAAAGGDITKVVVQIGDKIKSVFDGYKDKGQGKSKSKEVEKSEF